MGSQVVEARDAPAEEVSRGAVAGTIAPPVRSLQNFSRVEQPFFFMGL
jgi:hypothetical protein